MDKKKLREISNSLMFDVKENVIDEIAEIYAGLEEKIFRLKEIDTTNVEPMVRIDSNPISFLREDVVGESLPKNVVLENARNTEGDFVVINKGGSDV